jgi:tetratricopeptide (TPR) repeat protein
MASIVEGYEYDIFISYRQKDNKHDGWVTEFAENLKGELESTFKEEISVYFDINPHDGLLETHDVDASLQKKLKCLVFIPIISRTYCDPKSFAWSHEFKSFVELASHDRYGLKVRLSNGNIASRVLPVRIHDLDKNDIKLCESVLGGVMRGVDFIYKSSGVNRPLHTREDNIRDNQYHTVYRDQINKVALAVKDLIYSIQASSLEDAAVNDPDEHEPGEKGTGKTGGLTGKGVEKKAGKIAGERDSQGWRYKNFLKKSVITGALLVVLVAIVIIFSGGSTLPFSKRDWVVITDFENMTDNPVFDKSLYTAFSLITNQSRYINVFPRSRMIETLKRMEVEDLSYITDKLGKEIAEREGFSIYIVPGISKIGNRYTVSAKVYDAASGDLLKSEVLYADNQDDILPALDRLSKKIRIVLGESRYEIFRQDKPLKQATTSSLEALKLYSMGIDRHILLDYKGAKDYYRSALRLDTGFTSARASLGSILIEKYDSLDKGKELLTRALKSVDNLTERERLGILAFYAINVEKNFTKGIEYAKMRIALYPDDAIAHNNLAWYYFNLDQFENSVEEYKVSVSLDPGSIIAYSGLAWIYLDKLGQPDSALKWTQKMVSDNPDNAWGHTMLGSAWLVVDSLEKAENEFIKSKEMNPGNLVNLYRLAHTYRIQGKYDPAIAMLSDILLKNPDEISAMYDLGVNYQSAGNDKEAEKYYTDFKNHATQVWMKNFPSDPMTYIVLSAVTARLGELDLSAEMYEKAFGIDSTLHEKYAELLCLRGDTQKALEKLEQALKNGYRDLFWLKLTPDLERLRYDIRYRNLLEKYFG